MRQLDINDIKRMIAEDESRVLEVKQSTGELHAGMASACAFLNTDGGWLLFGISPKMTIIGQNVTDSTKQEIAKSLRLIEPAVNIPVQYIELPDKPGFYVIAMYFEAPTYAKAPYTFDGKPYYKVENTTAKMPSQMYEERIRISDPIRFSWERRKDIQLTIDDIDVDKVFTALQNGVSRGRIAGSALMIKDTIQVLRHYNVADNDGDLLNAANVIFGKEPDREFIQCQLRLARFEGLDMREFRDQTVIYGNLLKQLDAGMDFCRKHMFLSGKMELLMRDDRLTVPVDVLRECILNMLIHRSWDSEGESPSIAIFDDRIEFQNPGRFPNGTTAEDFLRSPHSDPRNPLIAKVFYQSGITENWGRGVPDIFIKCKEYGLPKPEYKIAPHWITLVLKFSKSLAPVDTKATNSVDTPNTTTTKTPVDRTNVKNDLMKSRTKNIFDIIGSHEGVSGVEIAKLSNLSVPTIRRILKILLDASLIEHRGSNKHGGYYIIKEIR